jgi:hypothetical protein
MLGKHFFNFNAKIALFIQNSKDVLQVDHSTTETEGFLVYFHFLNEAHFEEIVIEDLQIRLKRHRCVSFLSEMGKRLA